MPRRETTRAICWYKNMAALTALWFSFRWVVLRCVDNEISHFYYYVFVLKKDIIHGPEHLCKHTHGSTRSKQFTLTT